MQQGADGLVGQISGSSSRGASSSGRSPKLVGFEYRHYTLRFDYGLLAL
nr:hypothetical protein SYMBAF_70024 [Serratia symbiotica]